jgi:hypothetical protein
MSATGALGFTNCLIRNSGLSTTASDNSAGTVTFRNSASNIAVSTSSTGNINLDRTSIFMGTNTTAITQNGTANTGLCLNSRILSGSATAISIGAGAVYQVTDVSLSSSNSSVVGGAGTLQFGNVNFTNGTTIASTIQTPLVTANTADNVVSASGASYTTKAQDGIILVNGAVTPTIVPLASPVTGQRHRIKDNAGTAGASNITITPSGKNIDGAASTIINVNYGSVDIVYNGTQWNIL